MKNYSWYAPKAVISSPDNIHQTLAFGSLNDVQSLRKTVGKNTLTNIFLQNPKKVYTAPSLNFIAKFILHINLVDEQKYLKFTPRHTR
jgi:hypothetical protein